MGYYLQHSWFLLLLILFQALSVRGELNVTKAYLLLHDSQPSAVGIILLRHQTWYNENLPFKLCTIGSASTSNITLLKAKEKHHEDRSQYHPSSIICYFSPTEDEAFLSSCKSRRTDGQLDGTPLVVQYPPTSRAPESSNQPHLDHVQLTLAIPLFHAENEQTTTLLFNQLDSYIHYYATNHYLGRIFVYTDIPNIYQMLQDKIRTRSVSTTFTSRYIDVVATLTNYGAYCHDEVVNSYDFALRAMQYSSGWAMVSGMDELLSWPYTRANTNSALTQHETQPQPQYWDTFFPSHIDGVTFGRFDVKVSPAPNGNGSLYTIPPYWDRKKCVNQHQVECHSCMLGKWGRRKYAWRSNIYSTSSWFQIHLPAAKSRADLPRVVDLHAFESGIYMQHFRFLNSALHSKDAIPWTAASIVAAHSALKIVQSGNSNSNVIPPDAVRYSENMNCVVRGDDVSRLSFKDSPPLKTIRSQMYVANEAIQ